MRSLAFLFVLAIALYADGARACGDKFLVAARGTRFQRGPEPGRGYAVLVYAPQTSPLGERSRKEADSKALARAGYRPVDVESATDLSSRLAEATPGLVVASSTDAPSLGGRVAPESLVVVPPSAGTEALLDAVDAAVRRMARSGIAASARP
jgi:hypothetical protein